mmetsp:Transcript_12350/g.23692  ORF Transcript_12350/g.23692 Transcript_12350/m.23692 type:complete len:404 (-) Transcript_12350:65-1276(-)
MSIASECILSTGRLDAMQWSDLPSGLLKLILLASTGAEFMMGPLCGRHTIHANPSNRHDADSDHATGTEKLEPGILRMLGFGDQAIEPTSGSVLVFSGRACQSWRKAAQSALACHCAQVALPPVLHWDHICWEGSFLHPRIGQALRHCITGGMTMTCPAPDNTCALHSALASLSVSPDRFAVVKHLHLANHAVDDHAAERIANVFRGLRDLSIVGGDVTSAGLQQLARGCPELQNVVIFFCPNLNAEAVAAALCPARLPKLKKIFFLRARTKGRVSAKAEEAISGGEYGLAQCKRCQAWYPLNSIEKTCLHHAGTYSGYGASCSSYDCCGSMKPGYPYTPGCTFGEHIPKGTETLAEARCVWSERLPIMELFHTPYERKFFGDGNFWLRDAAEVRFAGTDAWY